jgi:26S proteasome regulatory subunit N10
MSMEEEQARQAAAAAASGQSSSGAENAPAPAATSAPPAVPAEPADDDDEAMLRQALAMSEGQDVEMHAGGDEEVTEEEAIARAIEMSMKPQDEQGDGKDKK